MNNERLKILILLEEGKITSEEANSLLKTFDSLEDENKQKNQNNNLSGTIKSIIENFSGNASSMSEELLKDFNRIDKKLQGKLTPDMKEFTLNLKSLQADLENIINRIIDDVNKSTGDITSTISEEASRLNGLVADKDGSDNLSRSMGELHKNLKDIPGDTSSLTGKFSDIFNGLTQINTNINAYNKTFRKAISDASSINLEFQAINGSISIEGYEGSEIEIEAYCKIPADSTDKAISIIDEEGIYKVIADENKNLSISFDIKIPKSMFNRICLSTSNGKIRALDLLCKDFISITSDAKISLSGLKCSIIESNTSEGKIELSDIDSEKVFLQAFNSPIVLDNIRCKLSDIVTTNSNIYLELSDTIYGKSEYKLSTDNGKIDVNLSLPPGTGISIDAFSLNGTVDVIDMPSLSYSKKESSKSGSSHIIGETPNYNTAANCVKVTAVTSKQSILIK